ncbi:MAG: hypothetical protein P4L99_21345 [Chthoniobacter sp.]|nr:hypothetical protein [Chthoniobacter sp.]
MTVLSAVQWQANRSIQLNVVSLQRAQMAQAAKLAEREQKIKDSAADLDSFRERVTQLDTALKEAESKLPGQPADNGQQDQLKKSVDEWTAAVAARDEQIKKANGQLESVAVERNAAVSKFNELAGKYNAVLKELNEARAKLASAKAGTTSSPH